MGVYIKGMEMPEGCPFCPLSHWTSGTNEFAGCNIVPSKRYAMLNDIAFAASLAKSRPDWCPLVEVPPHGDLIDAFAFRREMDANYPFDKFTQSKHGEADAAKSTILRMLVKAPTIIEAEE